MYFKRALSLFFAVMLFALAPATCVSAASPTGAELDVCVMYGSDAVVGMNVNIYLAATMRGTDMKLTSDFSMCTELLSVAAGDPDDVRRAAYSLESTVMLNRTIKPTATAVTGESGYAVFDGLVAGVYLVSCDSAIVDGKVYSAAPFLAYIYEADTTSGECIVAMSKTSMSGEKLDLEVVKLWSDACHPSARPASVELSLWCDGKLYDVITLPENGRWSHTWYGLDAARKWNITETPCEGYAAPEIVRDGNIVSVTNKCNKTTPPEIGDDLPPAGQLWWPVPIMLFVGVLLCAVGFVLKRGVRGER